MQTCEDFGTGKTRENFPVASRLIAPGLRAPIHAYYRFARAADDVADHARLEPAVKFELLDGLEATLLGRTDRDPAALPLRAQLRERALSPQHALDLLTAFRLDVTKHRYRDWDELMHYCRYSAMPVGRFVLELHGESRATWDASDPLCSALQVINHLQDCAKDYAALDRLCAARCAGATWPGRGGAGRAARDAAAASLPAVGRAPDRVAAAAGGAASDHGQGPAAGHRDGRDRGGSRQADRMAAEARSAR
jgi:hypothetical protein